MRKAQLAFEKGFGPTPIALLPLLLRQPHWKKKTVWKSGKVAVAETEFPQAGKESE